MRIEPLALALLLCACQPAGEANNFAEEANGGAPADVPIQGGQPPAANPPGQPVDGTATTDETGEIAFTVSPDSIPQGGTLTLTLANQTSELLGYNLCTSALQTADGAAVPTDRVCTMELRTVEPGRDATYDYEMPQDVAPGRYRLTTNIQRMTSGIQTSAVTEPFEVTAR